MEMQTSPNAPASSARSLQRYWMTLRCPRCAGEVLIEYSAPNQGEKVLRQVPEAAHSANHVEDLPEDVRDYYEGAWRVLQADVPDAAAVQLRCTLEAAANHFGVKPYPLVKAIRELISQGLVTAGFGEVLGHIKDVGNAGAHAGEAKIDREQAERAFRFTTQVLRNLFEIPAELERLGRSTVEEAEAEA
jgi:Domain of unknown function (DUF4145)